MTNSWLLIATAWSLTYADVPTAPNSLAAESSWHNSDFDTITSGVMIGDYHNGGPNDNDMRGAAGDDYMAAGPGADRLLGEVGDDLLYGGAGEDHLHGQEDNDALFGNEGQDQLFGNAGNDILHGDDGDDELSGNAGNDELHGNEGQDTFHILNGDVLAMSNVLALDCPTVSYTFHDTRKTWQDAENDCQSRGGHLATICDNDTLMKVSGLVTANFWIGLHDPSSSNTWEWASGNACTYRNWYTNEPNGDTEDCVMQYYTTAAYNNKWNDATCSGTRSYVCETAADDVSDVCPVVEFTDEYSTVEEKVIAAMDTGKTILNVKNAHVRGVARALRKDGCENAETDIDNFIGESFQAESPTGMGLHIKPAHDRLTERKNAIGSRIATLTDEISDLEKEEIAIDAALTSLANLDADGAELKQKGCTSTGVFQ